MLSRLKKDQCPECRAMDSLVVDYQLGEVVCNACGTVARGGLEEDPDTRYGGEEGDTGVEVPATGPSGRGAGSAKVGGSKYEAACMKMLHDLCEFSQLPESVEDTARHYAVEMTKYSHARNQRNCGPQLLAASCFVIAATLAGVPLPIREVCAYNDRFCLSPDSQPIFRASLIDGTKNRIVVALQLQDRLRAKQATLWPDLATLYLRRLHWPVAELVGPVARLADAWRDAVKSGMDYSTTLATVLLLTRTNKQIGAVACTRVVATDSERRKVVDEVCQATRHKPDELSNAALLVESDASKLKELIAKANLPLASEAAAPAQAENEKPQELPQELPGRKRARE